jgi:uncharacterized membrane protein
VTSNRSDILDWLDQGRLAPEKLRDALALAGVLPTAADWRRFLDRLLAFLGVALLAAGVIFFFAFNWQDLGRFAKFALVEAPIVVALALTWRLGVDGVAGKATLLFAALMAGALLALVGQTYQTGADTWELFAAWAAAILPWALVARFPALWILWLALLNASLALYFLTFGFLWGMLFAPEKLLWLLFGLNTAALVAWEVLAAGGLAWLRERWAARLLATASGGLVTALAIGQIVGWRHESRWAVPAWFAWMLLAYLAYRIRRKDVYVLAGGVLAAIAVVTTFLGRQMRMNDAGEFLFIGLVVIGMSAAGGFWLKRVATEEEA